MIEGDDPRETANRRRGGRTPAEIESEIRAVRARLEGTLEELEARLSPETWTNRAVDAVRDVLQGRPSPLGRILRENPVPLALIGVGAAWLAWNVVRRPGGVAGAVRLPPSGRGGGASLPGVLAGLVAVARQGADAFRRADRVLADPSRAAFLVPAAGLLDRAAAALEMELGRCDGGAVPPRTPHPAWADVDGALTAERGRAAALGALERGVRATLGVFRAALREPLPDRTRVVVGAQFHELETVEHRIAALRETAA